MPRLPDAASLGGLPGLNSGRPIATYDVSAVDTGISALGQGIEKVGEGIQHQADANDELSYMRAKASFLPQNIQLQSGFKDDPDYNTFQPRYEEQAAKARDEAAAGINSPKLRQKFLTETADDLARGSVSVQGMAHAREKDAGLGELRTQGDTLREQIAAAPTEPDRVRLIDTFSGYVDAARGKQWISSPEAVDLKRGFAAQRAEDWLKSLPNGQRAEALRGSTLDQSRIDRIDRTPVRGIIEGEASRAGMDPATLKVLADIESGGNPNAATGSYKGLFQLSEEEFKKYGETGASITDPAANTRAAIASLKDKQASFQQKYGRAPSATELYLMHQQGEGGFAAQMANPNQPAWQNMAGTAEGRQKGEAWAKQAIWGNVPDDMKPMLGSVDDVTGAQFMAAWAKKVQGVSYDKALAAAQNGAPVSGEVSPLVGYIPAAQRHAMLQQAELGHGRDVIAASDARDEQWKRVIVDAGAGKGSLPSRTDIEIDPALTENHRNSLLSMYDKANSDAIELQQALGKFNDKGATYNPFDKDDKNGLDKIYNYLGGNTKALQAVADRTGMVPVSAGTALRGDLVSSDPNRVAFAAGVTSNLLARNPNALAGIPGSTDIENTAVAYRQYVEHYGMTADQAAKKIIESQTPEYKAKVKAHIKPEDVADLVKKQLGPTDLTSAFNEGLPLIGRPNFEFTPSARSVAMNDYAELFKDRFLETGDVATAKAQAIGQLKKVWGITNVNGSGTIMRYPPEKAPAYQGIPDISTKIAEQAMAEIKSQTGQDVPRGKIMMSPTPGGQTAAAYTAGQPAPYALSWVGSDGRLQTLNPGKAFVADPDVMRKALSDQRQSSLERARGAVTNMESMAADNKLRRRNLSATQIAGQVPAIAGQIPEGGAW